MRGRKLRADYAIFVIFFSQAFAGGGLFARIPDIQVQADLSEAALGLALSAAAVGGLAIIPFSGRLVARAGTKLLICFGLPLLAATNVAAALAGGQLGLTFAMIIGGAAFAATNVAMNIEADRIEAADGGRVMNRCHGFWSLGILAASVIGVAARAVPVTPLWHFLAVMPPILAVAAVVGVAMHAAPERGRGCARRTGFALPDRAALMLALFGLSASVAQGGVQNWSVIFMRDTFHAADWVDTLTLPAFLAAMTLGRLFADRWVTQFGPVAVARALASLALAGALVVVIAPWLWAALIGFCLIGLGIAALFPLTVSAAARSAHRPAEDSVSSVILVFGLVMLLVPSLMGWVAETVGLRAAFAAILPMFIVTLSLSHLVGNARSP